MENDYYLITRDEHGVVDGRVPPRSTPEEDPESPSLKRNRTTSAFALSTYDHTQLQKSMSSDCIKYLIKSNEDNFEPVTSIKQVDKKNRATSLNSFFYKKGDLKHHPVHINIDEENSDNINLGNNLSNQTAPQVGDQETNQVAHQETQQVVLNDEPSEIIRCKICFKQFMNILDLRKHFTNKHFTNMW